MLALSFHKEIKGVVLFAVVPLFLFALVPLFLLLLYCSVCIVVRGKTDSETLGTTKRPKKNH